jgi:formylglycine-generating enzyme required for sulfatase activity
VADGPENPSDTLVLLAGDSAEVSSYVADKPGRLEYAFDAYTISLPRGEDALLSEQATLIGPGSVRLTAPTGVINVAILKVNRASGRDPNKVQGSPAPGSTEPAPAPAIVSVPQTRSVARGNNTTLFVSASGDDLTYQWKKNGTNIIGATSAGLPLENATGADEGNYTVVISNSEGSVTSSPIQVAVKMPAVPTGVYRINNSDGASGHEVALTGFSIDQHEVTKAFWDEVYVWAVANGYDFTNAGIAGGPEHPVHSVNWYDCVKWANALSERDGHTPCYYTDNNCTQIYRTGEVDLTNYNVRWNVDGYRLPTESEWEVATRGGLEGSKYAWGESASTSKANFDQSLHGATLPVGSYPSTGYGLFEVGGNLREWTWDSKIHENSNANSYNESFYNSFLGNSNLVSISDTDATHGWIPQNMFFDHNGNPHEPFYPSDGSFSVANRLTLPFEFFTDQVAFYVKARGYYYAVFKYTDGNQVTTEQVDLTTQGSDSITPCIINNPNPNKLLDEVCIYAKRYPGNWTYSNTRVFGFQVGKSYRSANSEAILTINLPDIFDDIPSHFNISINNGLNTESLTYNLVDADDQIISPSVNLFDSAMALVSNLKKIAKLKIIIPPSTNNSSNGGYFVNHLSWSFSNPKSFSNSNKRVLRDNHYAEGLQHLSKRNLSSPGNRYSTVGFRLVQRP